MEVIKWIIKKRKEKKFKQARKQDKGPDPTCPTLPCISLNG